MPGRERPREFTDPHAGLQVSIRAAVVICTTLVNTHTHRHAESFRTAIILFQPAEVIKLCSSILCDAPHVSRNTRYIQSVCPSVRLFYVCRKSRTKVQERLKLLNEGDTRRT